MSRRKPPSERDDKSGAAGEERRQSRQDRRVYPRFTVLWPGKIVMPDKVIGCTILNISATGAKIKAEIQVASIEEEDLPSRFKLTIKGSGTFDAEVMRHVAADVIGVQLLGDPRKLAALVEDAVPAARFLDMSQEKN